MHSTIKLVRKWRILALVHDFVKDKTILITGGAGSIGSGITRRVMECGAKAVRVFDIDETRLIELEDLGMTNTFEYKVLNQKWLKLHKDNEV